MYLINLALLITATIISALWLDKPLFNYINRYQLYGSSGLNQIELMFPGVTSKYFILSIALIGFIICARKYYKLHAWKGYVLLVYLMVCLELTIRIKEILNHLFGRCSPKTVLNNLCTLNSDGLGFQGFNLMGDFVGFPSGHCTIFMFCVIWLIYIMPKLSMLACVALVFLIFSLVISNYHFLSDCFGGCTLGYSCGLMSIWLWDQLHQIHRRYRYTIK